MPYLSLSDFELRAAHCELRTEPQFRIWDKTGEIWARMVERLPKLELASVSPNEQIFRLGHEYELKNQMDRHIIHSQKPSPSLKAFRETQALFTQVVETTLMIEHYKRIGLRVVYSKDFESRAAAVKFLLDRGLSRYPQGKHFGVEGETTEIHIVARVEGASNGWHVRLFVQERGYSLNVPLDWDAQIPESKPRTRLILDIDRYEFGLLPVGQVHIADWIHNAMHGITRDTDGVLKELL